MSKHNPKRLLNIGRQQKRYRGIYMTWTTFLHLQPSDFRNNCLIKKTKQKTKKKTFIVIYPTYMGWGWIKLK